MVLAVSWWIAAGVCFVLGLGLIVTGGGPLGVLGAIAGFLLLFAAMAVFAAAPMRYGRQKGDQPPASPAPSQAAPPVTPEPPRPRPAIEAADASEV